jgi:hypothetical protein
MTFLEPASEPLWIFTQAGAFRFLTRDAWEDLYERIADRGWDPSSIGDAGWLQSQLNPYPTGAFFSAADAQAFSEAARAFLTEEPQTRGTVSAEALEKVAGLFGLGAVLIRSEPPRKTFSTGLLEVVYGYSCTVCGFLHSGSWMFDIGELSLQAIRTSVESMLRFTYCPLCGSKDIIAVTFFLKPFDPAGGYDFMTWNDQAGDGPEKLAHEQQVR